MGIKAAPANTPVWVDTTRCKACDVCVAVCPSGTLSMKADPTSTLGAMVEIIAPQDCIGCNDCELSCPDFAIYVAEKSEFKFAKLTDKAKARAEAIKNNGYRIPDNWQFQA